MTKNEEKDGKPEAESDSVSIRGLCMVDAVGSSWRKEMEMLLLAATTAAVHRLKPSLKTTRTTVAAGSLQKKNCGLRRIAFAGPFGRVESLWR